MYFFVCMSYTHIIYHFLDTQKHTVKVFLNLWHTSVDRSDAEIIIGYILGKPSVYTLTHPNHILTASQYWRTSLLMKKRAAGVPLAQLLGVKEFYGLPFSVTKHTLVPRPESEHIVEYVLQHTKTENPALVLDLGTGTGCIALSIAHNTNPTHTKVIGTDISTRALKIAKLNAKKLQLNRASFYHSDLLKNPTIQKYLHNDLYPEIFITANLPYVDTALKAELLQKEESRALAFEPHDALFAPEDGLYYYRLLTEQLTEILSGAHHKKITVLCEINPEQSLPLKKLLSRLVPHADISTIQDLSGRDRIITYTLTY